MIASIVLNVILFVLLLATLSTSLSQMNDEISALYILDEVKMFCERKKDKDDNLKILLKEIELWGKN